MKMQRGFFGFVFLVLCFCTFMALLPAGAQGPDLNAPERSPLVLVDLHLVEMKEADADKLFKGSMVHAFYLDNDLLKGIRSMIAEGGARTIGRMRVATQSKQSAEVKGVVKMMYPGEYEEMGWTTPVAASGTNAPSLAWVQGGQAVKPADFSEQETGFILSATPVVSPDKAWVELTLIPMVVTCPNLTEITSSGPGGAVTVYQPEFFIISSASSVTCRSGATILLGAVTPPGDNGEKIVLSIMTATVVP